VVIESFWFAGRDDRFLAEGIRRFAPSNGIEVWCDATDDIAWERYTTRRRHPIHKDASRDGEWWRWAAAARPCSGLATMTVDTGSRVDAVDVAAQVRAALLGDFPSRE
jgi:hypothetical protein